MTMERDSLVARLEEYAGALDKYARSGRVKCWPGDNIFEDAAGHMREAAAALSRPEQVVMDAMMGAVNDLSALVDLVVEETLGPSVEDEPDNESVGGTSKGPLPMTFGHVRRAQEAIAVVRAALEAALHPAPEAASAGAAGEMKAIKLWPFEETPAEFAQRLWAAGLQLPDLTAAVRHVLIESPPKISTEYCRALAAPSDTAPSPKGVSDGVREWQPMETAPKDGKHILLCVKSGPFFYAVEGGFYKDQWLAAYVGEVTPVYWAWKPTGFVLPSEAALSQEPVPATAEERAASKEGA